ncbi:Rv3654c family TadE-like protein [Nocardioides nematodiphilus]|uniref:Rv3654c family TadE-like protein n=1 Tax=Nocardioides nematodiphilus TaxID=2849669 RepID=UPI001CD9B48D|nr:Rv3654c family TadE-like protein [Nocardioides nematodiphilus]MCA1981682.1 flp pilus-assembly TadE/G-like family protein [Nocardioides nematodiphilus]
MSRRHGRDECGAVTVLAVAMLGVLVLMAAALAVGEAMVVAHRRAQSAADLAALAAAQAIQHAHDPCAAAAEVATANGAILTGCAVEAYDVTISAAVPGPRWLGAHADFAAQAKAGPGPT